MLNSTILYRALKLSEKVYDESMYGVDDLYRIKDIIHSVDQNHWNSKEWLVKELYKHYKFDAGKMLVVGGWYGMMAYQLRQQWPSEHMNIESTDMDPMCEVFAWDLFGDQDINFYTLESDSRVEIDISEYTVIVNTSCEHMEQDDLLSLIKQKEDKTWVCFQTNDHRELDCHINCWPTAHEFAASLGLKRLSFVGSQKQAGFNRHMVIGR
tara:strand:+ start:3409 stop:4038 length:630 start_codon:yes stop_codon:yes gene_type:complete